jgi:hypothetical protein
MSHSNHGTIVHSFNVLSADALVTATGGVNVKKRSQMFDTLRKVIDKRHQTSPGTVDRFGR